jgi:RAB protein geranylgeranyltransferase component A
MDQSKENKGFEEDYLFIGVGLTESIVSASLSTYSKKSTNIEAGYNYSGTFCTLSIKELERILKEKKEFPQKDKIQKDFKCEFLEEGIKNIDDFIEKYGFRGFNLDFNPRLIFSMGKATDLMIEAQIDNYISFRSLKGLYFCDKLEGSQLETVPTDKGGIFKSKVFSLQEKKELFNFLNTAMRYYTKESNLEIEQNSINDFKKNLYKDIHHSINEVSKKQDFMNENFIEFMKSAGVTSSKTIRLIACCMCNYRVNPLISKKSKFEDHRTGAMLDRLTRFINSMHVHGELPYLYPIYGTGDITQICSRISAVYQSTFLLGTELEIKSTEYSEEEGHNLSILISGQETPVKAKQIYFGPEYRSLALNTFSKQIVEGNQPKELIIEAKEEEVVRYVAFLCAIKKKSLSEDDQEEGGNKPIFPLLCYFDVPPGTDDKVQSDHPISCMVVDHTCGTCTENCIILYFNYYKTETTQVDDLYLQTRVARLLEDKFPQIESITPIFNLSHNQSYREPDYVRLPNNVSICPDNDFALDMEDMFLSAKKEALQGAEGKLFKREGEERGDGENEDEQLDEEEISAIEELAKFTITSQLDGGIQE